MIARCVRERRRIMRYRLPTSSLKKLESRKYTKNEIYDTCAICLGKEIHYLILLALFLMKVYFFNR